MSEYYKLKAEFDKKIKELQENCSHTEFKDEQDEYWRVMSTTGRRVKYCKRCLYAIYSGDERW